MQQIYRYNLTKHTYWSLGSEQWFREPSQYSAVWILAACFIIIGIANALFLGRHMRKLCQMALPTSLHLVAGKKEKTLTPIRRVNQDKT